MKFICVPIKNTFSIGSFLLIIICSFFLPACKTTAYFNTPNDVYKMQGIVYMQDGTEKKGLITIFFEHVNALDNYINLIPVDGTIPVKIDFKNIKYYTVGNDTYVPKMIDLYMTGEYHYLFLKRLTYENARIQFYELPQLFKSNYDGEKVSYYFIAFPYFSRYELVNINSIKLIPEFDIKMGDYVSDCPELANKIRSKKAGYFYSSVSLSFQRQKVMEKIVTEYNNCK
jgi:hypothetical protein